MYMDNEILETLNEIRKARQKMMARQEEALQFLRDEAEKSTRIREEAILLQKQAVERSKRIAYLAVPLIFICAGMIVYLMIQYRIF
jgi:hypothetical protein